MVPEVIGDVSVAVDAAYVATVEIHRPPDNYFDVALIRALAEAYEAIDDDPGARAIVLCSEGKHFCAGAYFSPAAGGGDSLADGGGPASLYSEAIRLFSARTPVVAAVHGAAIGGGLGLACAADFRVAGPGSRWAANFARLGFHQGFGLSTTLPAIVGGQRALELLFTGRRVPGEEAAAIGLCDRLVDDGEVRSAAHELAREIALSAPLAIDSIRQTMRGDLPDQIRRATAREAAEQERLRSTEDFAEGIRAAAARRLPEFRGR